MIVIFRRVCEALLDPFFICLLLFFIAVTMVWLHKVSTVIRGAFLLTFLSLLLFSTGWLPHAITHHLETRYPFVMKTDPSIHWIVVLSGGQSEMNNRPPNALLNSASINRLVEGIRLYRQLPNAKIVLSGGGFDFQIPEAVHLAQLTELFNIPQKDVVLESTSVNTADQISAIQKIVQNTPFYLVTSAIHMPRVMAYCKAHNLYPIPAPTDFTLYWDKGVWGTTMFPNAHNLSYLSVSMHEVWGIAWSALLRIKSPTIHLLRQQT